MISVADYQIRAADKKKDLAKIRALNISCLEENYAKSFWKAAMTSGTVHLVAVTGPAAKPIGYVATMHHEEKLIIYSFAVQQHHRRRGVGRLLLVRLLELLREQDNQSALYLQVRCVNTAALGLYESLGFRESARLPVFYRNGGDAAEMVLALK